MFQWQCKLVLHSQTIFHAMDCKRLPANRQIFNWCPRARCTVKTKCKSVHMMGKNKFPQGLCTACSLVYYLYLACTLACVHVSVLVVYSIVHFFWQVVEPNTCTQFIHKTLPTSTVKQVCEAPCCGCCECSGRTFMKGDQHQHYLIVMSLKLSAFATDIYMHAYYAVSYLVCYHIMQYQRPPKSDYQYSRQCSLWRVYTSPAKCGLWTT